MGCSARGARTHPLPALGTPSAPTHATCLSRQGVRAAVCAFAWTGIFRGPGITTLFLLPYSKNRRSSGSEIAVYRPCHHLDPKAETDVTQFESVQERVRREMRPWSIGVALRPQCSYACPSRASTFWRLASRGLVSPLVGLLLTPNARVLHEDRGEREVERLTVGSLAWHMREHLRLAETVTASAHQVGQRDAARRQTQAVKSLPSCRDARLLLK